MRKVWFFICLLFIFTASSFAAKAVWVAAWELKSEEDIDNLIHYARTFQFQEILYEVRFRGDANYQPNKHDARFQNSEKPSIYQRKFSGDLLETLLQKAHAANLKVSAWATVFVIGKRTYDDDHPYHVHQDWVTYDYSRKEMGQYDLEGAYFDPALPEVRNYLLNIFSDIVANYGVDGLHLDYVRYPNRSYGYHPRALAQFTAETQQQEPQGESWTQWRKQQIDRFMAALASQVRDLRPGIEISAAVKPSLTDAIYGFGQDWEHWLNQKWIDKIYLMAYSKSDTRFVAQISEAPKDSRSVVGIRAWDVDSPQAVAQQVMAAAKLGFKQFCFFSYQTLIDENIFPALRDLGNERPSFASTYCFEGMVLDKTTSGPVEGALVLMENEKVVRTDAQGRFSLTGTSPVAHLEISHPRFLKSMHLISSYGPRSLFSQTNQIYLQPLYLTDLNLSLSDKLYPVLDEDIVISAQTSGFMAKNGHWETKRMEYKQYLVCYDSQASAIYRPEISFPGFYSLAYYLPEELLNSDTLRFQIHYAGGSTEVCFQGSLPSGWLNLGTFLLDKSQNVLVEMTGSLLNSGKMRFQRLPRENGKISALLLEKNESEVTLRWQAFALGNVEIWRKEMGNGDQFTRLAKLSGKTGRFQDRSILSGKDYEYRLFVDADQPYSISTAINESTESGIFSR